MRSSTTMRIPIGTYDSLQAVAATYKMTMPGAIAYIYDRAMEADQLRETILEQAKAINALESKSSRNRGTLTVIMNSIDGLDKTHPVRLWFTQNVLPKLEGGNQ